MSRIRRVEIQHFRGIERLDWHPGSGVSCLVGPGDVGKSTVLDAVELCLAGRRALEFSDSDFFQLDVATPIQITVTLGELDDELMSLDSHGLYLRGFDKETGSMLPEPEAGKETVLSARLTVGADLEPSWSLFSERAMALNQVRRLSWSDRLKITPTRLGVYADYNLGWRRGSILNRLSAERADASAELARFAREARAAFGESAKRQVGATLDLVRAVAGDLGVPVGDVTAMLDADSISLAGGTISLHDERGVPLSGLGLGSVRLLVAGLQRAAAGRSSILLIDEVEHGLEPHRISRLLNSLGAKDRASPLQVIMTTHSPVALRELSSDQLYVLRRTADGHELREIGGHEDMQSTVRACPEAFLAPAVIVCEGRSEMGLLRGLDLYRVASGEPSISVLGAAIADGHGDNTFRRANALLALGYRVLILRDSDKDAPPKEEAKFAGQGGTVVCWRDKRGLEDELFASLSDRAVASMIQLAIDVVGTDLVDAQIKSASDGKFDLASCKKRLSSENRTALGRAAKVKPGWFKSIAGMEVLGREVVGPELRNSDDEFQATIEALFEWVRRGE